MDLSQLDVSDLPEEQQQKVFQQMKAMEDDDRPLPEKIAGILGDQCTVQRVDKVGMFHINRIVT